MDSTSDTWQRLMDYQRELAELCERVDGEMTQNRQIREKWHDRTISWKKIWMPDKTD